MIFAALMIDATMAAIPRRGKGLKSVLADLAQARGA